MHLEQRSRARRRDGLLGGRGCCDGFHTAARQSARQCCRHVRSVLALFGIYVLAVLLAGTFPIGAGDAMHGGSLLHPAFPHVHERSGAQSRPAAQAASSAHYTVGFTPAWDASAGGATEVPSTALTPPLPRAAVSVGFDRDARLPTWDHPQPPGVLEPPPDPPPTSLGFAP